MQRRFKTTLSWSVITMPFTYQTNRDDDPTLLGVMRNKEQTLQQMTTISSQPTMKLKEEFRTQYGIKKNNCTA